MQKAESPLQLMVQTPDKTRLMIGLNWDPRKPTSIELAPTKAFTGTFYILALILWLPLKIISILLYAISFSRIQWHVNPPDKMSSQLYYETLERSKSTDTSAREKNYKQYDLDLHCFVFDTNKNPMTHIGPESENMIDAAGAIYHSGEEFTGQGIYDDETIHIDLKRTSPEAENFFIVVTSDNHFDFASLDNTPRIRLVDNKTEVELFSADIPKNMPEAKGKHAFIAGRIQKLNDIWSFHALDIFCDFDQDWQNHLKSYL